MTTQTHNALASGFAQAASEFELHCEMVAWCERERQLQRAQRTAYEPPAAPDVEFPETRNDCDSNEDRERARQRFRLREDGMYEWLGPQQECVFSVGELLVVVLVHGVIGLYVGLGVFAVARMFGR